MFKKTIKTNDFFKDKNDYIDSLIDGEKIIVSKNREELETVTKELEVLNKKMNQYFKDGDIESYDNAFKKRTELEGRKKILETKVSDTKVNCITDSDSADFFKSILAYAEEKDEACTKKVAGLLCQIKEECDEMFEVQTETNKTLARWENRVKRLSDDDSWKYVMKNNYPAGMYFCSKLHPLNVELNGDKFRKIMNSDGRNGM